MKNTFNKILGLAARLYCKFYECLSQVYTVIRRGWEADASRLLLDHFTEAQRLAQVELDQITEHVTETKNFQTLVIIPFKDRWDLTAKCLEALSRQSVTGGWTMRVILVDNGSIADETRKGVAEAQSRFKSFDIQCLRADYQFNFSRLNNDAFTQYKTPLTKYVLFLNNDVELNDPDILKNMTNYLEKLPKVGVVGSVLLYPNRSIQHIFAAPGVKIIAAHPLKGVDWRPDFEWFAKKARPVPAVTGAVMMLRCSDFAAVGMFDEALPTLAQDIVLCLKIYKILGKYAVTVNSSQVIHHESMTKSPCFPTQEINHTYAVYSDHLSDDTFFNRAISRWSEKPLLAMPGEPKYPARMVARYWT